MISRLTSSFLLLLLLIGCKTKPTLQDVKEEIVNTLNKQTGVFAVAFKDLTTGEEILINEHQLFHAASTMKAPVMVEVYKQAIAGKFSLKDSLLIKNDFKSIVDSSSYSLSANDDSDTLIYKNIGEKRTVYSLVYDMIIISSNLATNLIVELVDAKNVTQTMRDMGANDIQVLRGVEDTKAFNAGLNNQVTAYDLMLVYENIANEEIVNAEASLAMINILLDQRFNEIIPAQLPKEVKVAHKTGSITGVRHDSGIVFLPDGRKYVLVLLSKELNDADAGIQAMADVPFLLYDCIIKD
jgi:beta-lactamase class A